MDFVVEVWTSEKGFIECKLTRTKWQGKEAVYADMWQSMDFLGGSFTSFRAAVWLLWDGKKYNIVDPKGYKNANSFWIELERQLSNTIIVNE